MLRSQICQSQARNPLIFGDKSCFEQTNKALPKPISSILSGYKQSVRKQRLNLKKIRLRVACSSTRNIGCISGMNCEIMFTRIALTELYGKGFPFASSEFNSEISGLNLENPTEVIYDENAHWR